VKTFIDIEPELPMDRITYRDGQLLTARDLRDDKRRDDRLRWLHTRYLHDTWGIALGYEVQRCEGNDAVIVGPGYAVDSSGRDIVLAEAVRIAVPNVSGPAKLVLVARHSDSPFHRLRHNSYLRCGGLDLRNDRPVLLWLQPGEVRFGQQVPLVSVTVVNLKISGVLDFRVRHKARRLLRPHIGWGSTGPGRTGWKDGPDLGLNIIRLQVTVDTSGAGFTKTPFYFAAVEGHTSSWPGGSTQPRFLSNPLGFITDAASDRFTYEVAQVGDLPPKLPAAWFYAEALGWRVSWFGLESFADCPLVLNLNQILDLRPLLSSFANEVSR
jgi:hypothetical protein